MQSERERQQEKQEMEKQEMDEQKVEELVYKLNQLSKELENLIINKGQPPTPPPSPTTIISEPETTQPKRGRGRPRKYVTEEQKKERYQKYLEGRREYYQNNKEQIITKAMDRYIMKKYGPKQ